MRIGAATDTAAVGDPDNPCPAGQVWAAPNCLPAAPEQQGEVTGGTIVSWSQYCDVGQVYNPLTGGCVSTNWLLVGAAVLSAFLFLKGAGSQVKGRR